MINIIPINDEHAHEESTTCWCNPQLITGYPELVVVHNAADCRELIEQAEEIKEAK